MEHTENIFRKSHLHISYLHNPKLRPVLGDYRGAYLAITSRYWTFFCDYRSM